MRYRIAMNICLKTLRKIQFFIDKNINPDVNSSRCPTFLETAYIKISEKVLIPSSRPSVIVTISYIVTITLDKRP